MKNKVNSAFSEKLPKSNRILKWKNFRLKGKVLKESALKVSYKNNCLSHSRLGIVVSKRISKSAVIRNKIKRILRESFRTSMIRNENLDIVLIVTRPFDKLNSSFCEQLKNAFLSVEKEILWGQTKREV